MGLNFNNRYPNSSSPDPNTYPFGGAINNTTPGGTDGTPIEKDFVNDILGILQKLLTKAGITPSGVPDTFSASDYYDALLTLFTMKYDSISDMVAADLPLGTIVMTKGYTNAGDGGHAFYLIVGPSTGTTDGGQFIDLSNTNQAQLIPVGPVNSKQYGAVGNGVTDDSAAIQNLINAFDDIIINTNSLFVSPITLRSNVKILISEVLIVTGTACFVGTAITQTRIEAIGKGKIVGDNATLTQRGIELSGAIYCSVDNVLVANCLDKGIIFQNASIDSVISGCFVSGSTGVNGAGIEINGTTSSDNKIINSKATSCTNGIVIYEAVNTILDNPVTTNNNSNGIHAELDTNTVIKTPSSNNNNLHGISTLDSNYIQTIGGVVNGNITDGINHKSVRTRDHGVVVTNNGRYGIATSDGNVASLSHRVEECHIDGNTISHVSFTGTAGNNSKAFRCTGYVTERSWTQSLANGGGVVVPHLLSGVPVYAIANNSGGRDIASVIVSGTNVTISAQNVDSPPSNSDVHTVYVTVRLYHE